MEPMALGSPAGSPAQTPNSPGAGSAYLPGFLLGDTNTQARLSVMSQQGITSPISHYGTPDYRINRQKAVFGSATSPNTSQIGTESHAGGPPTRGLFDSLETSQSMLGYTPNKHQSIINTTCTPTRLINITNNSPFLDNPSTLNTNESQGLLQWVTVFGFSLDAVDNVLSYVSSRVHVVDHHAAPLKQCNWIHLKCASEQEAQRALSCNCSIVSGSIMIGVIPCTDEGVLLGFDKENCSKLNNSVKSFTGPRRLVPGDTSMKTPIKIQKARPLAAGYSQHLSPQSVRSPENMPQKSTGLVSKAMEYMFGW
ncbi:nucleoporin NUP35-like isoform X2 [Prorops nasuta]